MVAIALTATTWIAIGSVGSFVAAAATTGVALVTRKLAGATKESAQAARDAVEAMEEPFVIAVPTPFRDLARDVDEPQPPEQIHIATRRGIGPLVRLRLWNIGTGPAIVERVTLAPDRGENCLDDLPGGSRPVGAGQWADLQIPSPRPVASGDGMLAITYTHSSGRRYQTSSVASIGDPMVFCLTYERSRITDGVT